MNQDEVQSKRGLIVFLDTICYSYQQQHNPRLSWKQCMSENSELTHQKTQPHVDAQSKTEIKTEMETLTQPSIEPDEKKLKICTGNIPESQKNDNTVIRQEPLPSNNCNNFEQIEQQQPLKKNIINPVLITQYFCGALNLIFPTTNNTQTKQEMEFQISGETFENMISYQKALLIGGYGVGKSTIFNKAGPPADLIPKEFSQFILPKLGFALIDSPSFDLDQSIIVKENLLQKFSQFLNEEKAEISTFFLVIKYDRIDVMKKNFYSIIRHFKQYLPKVRVLITFWDLRAKEQEKSTKKDIEDFFTKCKVILAGYIENSTDPNSIQRMLKKSLTGQKGINLGNTIFEIQENKGKQEMISNLQMSHYLQDAKLQIAFYKQQY